MACRLYDPNLEWRAEGRDITPEAAAKGIKVDDLPKTFRDAVDVTRRLGVTYLWIDSLCIIQNSKADWRKESFKMGLLYANAYLTLAADGAKNSYEGPFHDRKAATISPLVVHCSQYKERLGDDMFVLLPADFWKETVSDSNLGRRAWCLQERVLSNAVIHFGRNQVAWECKGGDFCETFPKGLPAGLQDENTRFISPITDNGRYLGRTNGPATTRPRLFEGSTFVVHLASPEDWTVGDENGTPGTASLDKYYIWSTDLGVFLVVMNADGFGNTVIHDDDGAPRSAGQGHAMVELVKDVLQAARKKRSRFCCSSGVKSARSPRILLRLQMQKRILSVV
jgi:hypothetical protein